MPIAMMALTMPAPNTAVSMMADRIAGKAKPKSANRMMTSSTQPRRAAARRPNAVPITRPMLTAMRPTAIEARAPTSNSDATSRPYGSVPSQWLESGASILAPISTTYGEYGVHTKETRAASTSSRLRTAPMTKLRWPNARFQKPGPCSSGGVATGMALMGSRSYIACLHTRVDHGIQQVDGEIHDNDHRRQQHDAIAHDDQ